MTRAAILLCLLGIATGAAAQTSCRLGSAGSLAFGPYDVSSPAPNDTLANIVVTCDRVGGPRNVTVTMGLGPGSHGTSVNARQMRQAAGTGDALHYGLYRDVGRSAVWGLSSGVDAASRTLEIPNNDSISATFTIFARIPARQDVSAGLYGDSVQITLSP